MTVETTDTKEQFVLNQSDKEFDFTFRALTSAPTDIKAKSLTGSTETILTYTTDYTVTVSTDGIGGTLWLVDETAVSKGTLTIYRETTDKQESDYNDFNQFPADTLETDLDKRTLKSQEQEEAIDRTLLLPISVTGVDTTLPIPVASQLLGWNSGADGIINYEVASAVLPTIQTGDAGKIVAVLPTETGYANVDNLPTLVLTHASITNVTVGTLDLTDLDVQGNLTATSIVIGTSSTITTVATGGSDNDRLATQGYVDDNVVGGGGKLVARSCYAFSSVSTGTSVIPFDDSIPQFGEGDQYMVGTHTPSSATTNLRIDINIYYSNSATANVVGALFQDGAGGALAAGTGDARGTGSQHFLTFSHCMTSSTTSEISFSVEAGSDSGTLSFNGSGGSRLMGGVMASTLIITETEA